MLDINLIRENLEKVKDGIQKKGYDLGVVDEVLTLDERRRHLLSEVEVLRKERNKLSQEQDEKLREQGREIKEKIKLLEEELRGVEEKYLDVVSQIPNLPADDVPVGSGEKDNVEIEKVGKVIELGFEPKDHVELGKALDIIDFESGSKVAGSDFYYLKNDGVLLEMALVQYGIGFLQRKGWIPVITPDLAHERYCLGTGYSPKGPEAQTYKVEDSDLGLVATAEITLAGLHSDEALSGKELPKKYAGYTHCFRKEAGSYGKYSKGLYRVHQFSKVEMFVVCKPEDSEKTHQEILELEKEFWSSLKIPYRVVQMCTGDLGSQAAKKFDLEAWMAGRGEYGEVTSTSNTTDYQARRLNIKYSGEKKNEYAHTVNGTLVATSRAIIAILENFQQKDGSVLVPEVLQKWVGKEKITHQ